MLFSLSANHVPDRPLTIDISLIKNGLGKIIKMNLLGRLLYFLTLAILTFSAGFILSERTIEENRKGFLEAEFTKSLPISLNFREKGQKDYEKF